MPPQAASANPERPSLWWKKAVTIAPDPAQLDILAYEAHSASKFDETDFLYLKALWRNRPVTKFHVSDYVRAEYVTKAHELVGRDEASLPSDQAQALGAFLVAKWLLEQTKPVNNNGSRVGGDTLKIVRRSARLKQAREAKAAPGGKRDQEELSLNQQMEALAMNRPTTPPEAPTTPALQVIGVTAAMVDTHELQVLSPENLDNMDKARSEDEEIVNSALVNLLAAITLCSGIMCLKGREGLQWVPRRQSFSLGTNNSTVCEARTDGLLRSLGSPTCGGPLAILEVKPYKRSSSQVKIEWQEACQMAAWISTTLGDKTAEKRRAGNLATSDETKGRRLLISQDYRHLYMTVGEWGQGYETYLSGGPRPVTPPPKNSSPTRNRGRASAPTNASIAASTAASAPAPQPQPGAPDQEIPISSNSVSLTAGPRKATREELDEGNFLVMNCYGPYSLEDPQHLGLFIRNVLALMLELSDPWG